MRDSHNLLPVVPPSSFLLHPSVVSLSNRDGVFAPPRRSVRRLCREALAGAADPVAAIQQADAPTQGGKGMRRIPANPAQTAKPFQWFLS